MAVNAVDSYSHSVFFRSELESLSVVLLSESWSWLDLVRACPTPFSVFNERVQSGFREVCKVCEKVCVKLAATSPPDLWTRDLPRVSCVMCLYCTSLRHSCTWSRRHRGCCHLTPPIHDVLLVLASTARTTTCNRIEGARLILQRALATHIPNNLQSTAP